MAALRTDLTTIEGLLRPASQGAAAQGWAVRFAAAAEAANRHLGPEQLARVIVELSDSAWQELASLRRAAADELRASGEATTAFGQLLRAEEGVWEAVSRLRSACRATGGSEARVAAVALGGIRVAVTPPRARRVTSAARAESRDADDARMTAAEGAVGDERARAFLERYRAARVAAAEQREELRTQKGLAAAAGVSAATINSIETGKVMPQLGTVLKLARALGVGADELLRGR